MKNWYENVVEMPIKVKQRSACQHFKFNALDHNISFIHENKYILYNYDVAWYCTEIIPTQCIQNTI